MVKKHVKSIGLSTKVEILVILRETLYGSHTREWYLMKDRVDAMEILVEKGVLQEELGYPDLSPRPYSLTPRGMRFLKYAEACIGAEHGLDWQRARELDFGRL